MYLASKTLFATVTVSLTLSSQVTTSTSCFETRACGNPPKLSCDQAVHQDNMCDKTRVYESISGTIKSRSKLEKGLTHHSHHLKK
ncbi:uncharacterized protein GGS22DRAFT_172408 [Annulohypoxylon maeteangense]|uniref:uncharacterized protein n=1 Tax=Annulohypoxylon maeteangense TaxID=1927788 RepID=UPI002008BB66|nr:uncharacterized protein GGS22DRAFT_172408 [Annulohypoxylon maeteangense]KAI0881524.1 hypothetical protein GGS22DRAFT_172408 [Annulohypoxylon maeteangense]